MFIEIKKYYCVMEYSRCSDLTQEQYNAVRVMSEYLNAYKISHMTARHYSTKVTQNLENCWDFVLYIVLRDFGNKAICIYLCSPGCITTMFISATHSLHLNIWTPNSKHLVL